MKDEKIYLRWSRGIVDEKIVTMKEEIFSALKGVAGLAQNNVRQVARSVESSFSEHRK